jgi:glyoxylase-like metal-dependent hydrolase (beta-lactamase superfamily II)
MDKNHTDVLFPDKVSKGVFKLSDSVYAISCKFLLHAYFLKTYSFLLVRENPFGLMIIDTGGPGSGRLILDAVEKLGFSKQDVKAIVISHWHKDHTGGLAEIVNGIQPKEPIKVYLGENDFPLLTSRMIRPIWFHPVLHFPIPHQSGKNPDTKMVKFIKINSSEKNNLLAEWGIEAIPSPGHTPGHTSYFHRESGVLFPGCGISIMPRKAVCIVPIFWRRREMIKSAQALAELDFTFLHPAHFLLEANEIPKEKRLPVKKLSSCILRLFGVYPIFRY